MVLPMFTSKCVIEVVSTKVIAAVQYAAMMNFCYIYRGTSYCADVRGRKMGYTMLEWKKIVLGYKYNYEEFKKIEPQDTCSFPLCSC
jgi:hypothetical protein